MLHYFFDIPMRLLFFCAILFPFIMSLIVGPPFIAVLRRLKAGQPIREKTACAHAPDHSSKKGTPTMGGLMIIGLIILSTLLFGDLSSPSIHACLLVLVMTAGLGFLDDFAKIKQKGTDGVNGWVKILIQTLAAGIAAYYIYTVKANASEIVIPFIGWQDIGWWFIPLSMLVIIAGSNAVNLTDGLDGLASGSVAIAAGLLTIVAESSDMNILLASITFACLGFLWFNAFPAKVFMGDTGSLSLGGALSTVAVCTGNHLIFIFIGGLFVVEASSVIIQRMGFKLTRKITGTGRRIFLMAPIHHHFEKLGWSETQVCIRFWIISLLFGLTGALAWYVAVIQY